MSNTTGTIVSPATPAFAMYERIARFLQTGSLTPIFSSAPAFRASSAVTAHPGAATTGAITLSANIVAGDLILANVVVASQGYLLTPPAGWSLYTRNLTTGVGHHVFYKIAVAGDIGASVTFTSGTSTAWSISTCSYSGVWAACPFNGGGQGFTVAASENTMTAPAVTTTVTNTLVIQASCISNNGAGLSVPATNRAADTGGTLSGCISEQAQLTPGTTSGQTISWTTAAVACTVQVVLQGVPTTVSAPAGNWAYIDSAQQATSTNVVTYIWQTSSNNSGITWYLVFFLGSNNGYGGGTSQTDFRFYACETYSTSTRVWNAPTTACNNAATGNAISSGTSPPWAQVWGSNLGVGNPYASQVLSAVTMVIGTTNLLVAANADGFFLSVYTTSTLASSYVGAFTSLVTNPALTDGGIVHCNLMVTAGQGASRDPGPTTFTYFSYYNQGTFWPNSLAFQGNVNGANTSNDIYQAAATTLITSRVSLSKGQSSAVTLGNLRGLLPTWLQLVPTTGMVWGDTVTEGSDTLTYVQGISTNLFIDTSVA